MEESAFEPQDYSNMLKEKKPFKTALKYGIVLACFIIVVDLIFYLISGRPDSVESSKGLSIIQMVVLGMLTIYLAGREHSNNDLNGFLPYNRVIKLGWTIGLFAGIVLGVYNIIKVKFFYADFDAELELKVLEELEKQSSVMSMEELETAKAMSLKMAKIFSSPFMMFISTIISYLFWMLILSVLLGFGIKKNFPED